MTRSTDLAALEAQHAALAADLAEQERELAQTQELIEHARRRRSLPLLAELRVASPCRADWSRMEGDERVRHCGECKQYVYNLSAMTLDQAERLIGVLEGRACVRYYERPDGTILFADCTVVRSRRRRTRVALAGVALAVGAGMIQLARQEAPFEPEDEVVLGGMEMEDQFTVGVLAETLTEPLGHDSSRVLMGDIDYPDPEPPVTEEEARARAVEEALQIARSRR